MYHSVDTYWGAVLVNDLPAALVATGHQEGDRRVGS